MTPVSNEPVSADEIERIILDTEPESMSAKGDKVWARRMAEALAAKLPLRSQSPEPSSSEPVDWQCEFCRCKTFARVDERKSDGTFGPGPQVRCVECKGVSALSPTVSQPVTGEDVEVPYGLVKEAVKQYVRPLRRRMANQRKALARLEKQNAALKAERDALGVELSAAVYNYEASEERAEAAEARLSAVEGALKPFADAAVNYDQFWAEETGGQDHPEGEDAEMVTFFALGSDFDMVPLAAFRRAREALTTITGGENER